MRILLATRAVFYKATMSLPADVGMKMKRTLSNHEVHLNSKDDHDWPDWNDYDAVIYMPQKLNLFGGVMQQHHVWTIEQLANVKPHVQVLRLVDDVYHFYEDFIYDKRMNEVAGIDAARARKLDGVVCIDLSWGDNPLLAEVAELPWYWLPYTTVGYRDHVARDFPMYPRRDGTSDCVYVGWSKPERVQALNYLFDCDYDTATFGIQLAAKTQRHSSYKRVKLNVMELIYAESGSSIVLGTPDQKNVVTSRFFESSFGGSPAIFHESLAVPGMDNIISTREQLTQHLGEVLGNRQYWVDGQVAFAKGIIEDQVHLYTEATCTL